MAPRRAGCARLFFGRSRGDQRQKRTRGRLARRGIRIAQQRLERTQPEDLVEQLALELLLFRGAQGPGLDGHGAPAARRRALRRAVLAVDPLCQRNVDQPAAKLLAFVDLDIGEGELVLVDAGAELFPTACGACAGYGETMADDTTVISSTARNFKGRMGSPTAQVYLASPYTVAASALRGVITDPRELLA